MRDNHGFDDGLAEIVYKFSDYNLLGISPSSEEVSMLVKRWQKYLNDNCYECNDELLQALGAMYSGDDFREKIDVFGKGTALYMSRAIAEYFKK